MNLLKLFENVCEKLYNKSTLVLKYGVCVMKKNQMMDPEFFQDAFMQWQHSLINEEKGNILAFWSEYSEFEAVLYQLKENLEMLYHHIPDYYFQIYDEKVKNPVKKTFDRLQEIFSVLAGRRPLNRPSIDKAIQRIVESGEGSRYKVMISFAFAHPMFEEEDPVFSLWLDAMLEVQQIPFQLVLDEHFGMYLIENFMSDLKKHEKYQKFLKMDPQELYQNAEFNQLFIEHKKLYALECMLPDILHDMDIEKMEALLEQLPSVHYPDVIANIFNSLDTNYLVLLPEFDIDLSLAIERIIGYMAGWLKDFAKKHHLLLDYKKIQQEQSEIEQCITYARAIQSEEDYNEFITEFYQTMGAVVSTGIEEGEGKDKLGLTDLWLEDEEYQVVLSTICESLTVQLYSEVITKLVDEEIIDICQVFMV